MSRLSLCASVRLSAVRCGAMGFAGEERERGCRCLIGEDELTAGADAMSPGLEENDLNGVNA